jgi:hypothetical protein
MHPIPFHATPETQMNPYEVNSSLIPKSFPIYADSAAFLALAPLALVGLSALTGLWLLVVELTMPAKVLLSIRVCALTSLS